MNDLNSSSAAQGQLPSPERRPVKRQKVAIACDVCRAKKVKCDGLRPVCSPCAKRADRGVPCEYTAEVRTTHGPSKGYVHHLESKLRELQNSATPHHEVSADNRPQLFSAINKPRHLESAWSTAPPTPMSTQNRQPFGYSVSDSRSNQSSPAASARESTQGQFAVSPGTYPTSTPSQQSSTPFLDGPLRTHPNDTSRNAGASIMDRTLTASALRGSMEAPSPPVPSAAPSRPLLFKRADARGYDGTSPHLPGLGRNIAHISTSPAPRPGYFSTGRSTSFVRQIRSAIDSRFHTTHQTPGAASTGSPHLSLPKMEGTPQSPQSVDYVLPSRKTADNLFRIYWETVHPIMPFLNRSQFEEAYAGIWSGTPAESDESLMMCTLNVVFALASQYSGSLIPRERETSAGKFFDRAQDLLNLDLWGIGSVELVQCLLLMGQYLQSINSLHQCWTVGGLATRVAEGLGLHLPETSANLSDIRQREHLRRLWHGCILMDRILSLQFGRPAMIDRSSAKSVPLPLGIDDEYLESGQPADQPAALAYYVSSLQCFDILNRAQKTSAAIEDQELDQRDQYRLLFGHSDLANVTSVLELDQDLSAWYNSLPPHLAIISTSRLDGTVLGRQAQITRVRYLHGRILIFRPVLSRFCLTQNELSSSVSKFDDSLPQRMALSCSTLCLRAAHEMISMFHESIDHTTVLGNIPMWWNSVFYVYTSATVLQAARLKPMVETSVGDYNTETSWNKAIGVLRTLERFGSTAQRSVVALEILADKITETIGQGQQGQGQGREKQQGGTSGDVIDLPTPAPSTWTNPSVGQTPAPLPSSSQQQQQAEQPAMTPSGGSIQFPGLGDPFDLAEFDFDLNDMSWLTSAPVDF